ncbi:MAG: hypothetical protein QOD61_1860, partial [Solirubrobacteraceae bacterium]|nr:hypothetical protein [Solirubrobacteraceae bacterium]
AALTSRDIQALPVPEGVKEVLQRRLAPLAKPAIDLLAVAAVVGQRFRLAVLEEVLGKDADTLLETLDELMAMGVVAEVPGEIDSFAFAHNLVRETQYEQLSASRRVRLHAAIGRTLEAAGASPPAELAHHFFEARQLLGPEPSIAYSLDAAGHASTALAHEEAIEHYERALEAIELAGADLGRRCETLLDLGAANDRLPDVDRARECYARAAGLARELGASDLLARAALGFAQWHQPGIIDAEAIQLLEAALAALPESAHTLRAMTLARLADSLDPLEAQERREALAEEALGTARGLDDPETLGAILHVAPAVFRRPESLEHRLELAEEAARLAERTRDGESLAQAHMHRFLDLFELGRPAAASEALAAYSRAISRLHQPWFDRSLFVVQAMLAILDARLEDAQELRAQAGELDQATDPDGETWTIQGFLIADGTERLGDADEDALRRSADRYSDWPLWRAMLARALVGQGRVAEGRVEFDRCARLDFSDLPPTRDWLATLVLLAETAHALGDGGQAATLTRLLTPYADRMATMELGLAAWGSVERVLGLLALTAGDRDRAAAHLERGLRADRERGAALWSIRGALAYRDLLPEHLLGSTVGQGLVDDALALARSRGLLPGEVRLAVDGSP